MGCGLLQIGLSSVGQKRVVQAVNSLGQEKSVRTERFAKLVELLRDPRTRDDLQVSIIQLINVLVNTPLDIDVRLPLRSELHNLGLTSLLMVQLYIELVSDLCTTCKLENTLLNRNYARGRGGATCNSKLICTSTRPPWMHTS